MFFIPMRKADAANRILIGRLDETPDRNGMVLDYASSKEKFKAWSDDMFKASGGKSYGNVRLMHQLHAAGLVQEISFDDNARTIDFMIKVADDQAWDLVDQGVLTGISQGGRYGRRWHDGKNTRYTAIPNELSLVDAPCNPSATFSMLKADGAEEARSFAAPTAEAETRFLVAELAGVEGTADIRAILIAQPAQMIKALYPTDAMRAIAQTHGLQKADYSDAEREDMAKTGEAMPGGEYPVRTKKDVEDAVDAFGRAKDPDATKKHITARAKALDATDKLPADWNGSTKMQKAVLVPGVMLKGLCDAAWFGELLANLNALASQAADESLWEGDKSPIPARLVAWISDGADIFSDMLGEESAEAVASLKTSLAANPAMKKAFPGGSMTGVATIADMAKFAGESAVLRDKLTASEKEAATLRATLAKVPQAGGPFRQVTRSQDVGTTPRNAAADATLADLQKLPEGREKAVRLARWTMDNPKAV